MKVRVEPPTKEPRDYPLSTIGTGDVSILTYNNGGCAPVGSVVSSGPTEAIFLSTGTWTSKKEGCTDYRWRKLLPGEKIIIEGE